jgi:SAM-dependent methyltransferase
LTEVPQRNYPGRDLEAMAFAERYHAWIARYFAPHLQGVVAEVGAGTGQFTECLLSPRIERLYALEPAGGPMRQLKARFAQRSTVRPLEQTLGEAVAELRGSLDGLVYCNVLEHVEDDLAELRNCALALKPGGRLCIFVPALPCLMSDFDRSIGHFRRYMPGRLRALAAAAGLEVRQLRWFDSLGSVTWLVFMKWLRIALSPMAVARYDRWIVPWLLWIEARIAPPIGKNLLMIAQRPATS